MAKSSNKLIQKAIWSYEQQVQRCRNKNNKYFCHYGAKNLNVHYSKDEFIWWWLCEMKNFTGKIPTVSRIDHDKGYSFDNVILEDKCKNSKERNVRVCSRKTLAFKYPSQEFIGSFKSGREAARKLGLNQADVRRVTCGMYKQTHGLTFKNV